jgi:hypothetical protein
LDNNNPGRRCENALYSPITSARTAVVFPPPGKPVLDLAGDDRVRDNKWDRMKFLPFGAVGRMLVEKPISVEPFESMRDSAGRCSRRRGANACERAAVPSVISNG